MTTRTSHKNSSPFSAFILHLHPRKIPADTIRFTLSFGLGGMATTLFFILVGSGILQILSYIPNIMSAHQSVVAMYSAGSPAGFVRNIHYWAGNLFVIVALLHLLRVYLTGATDRKRRVNWLIGIALFLLVLFANFTGYLLPWDQLAFWAVTIFTNMIGYVPFIGERLAAILRGGDEVGATTLSTFFAIHVGLIPALMIILLIFHFWLIRKAGGLVRDPDSDARSVASVPHLVSREGAVGLGLAALLFLFAALVDAPLAEIANPGESPNPAKAAWYFLGLQELLLHFHPIFAICIFPALMLASLTLLPYLPGITLSPGVWCGGAQGRISAAAAFFVGLLASFPLTMADDLLIKENGSAPDLVPWITRGLLPLGVILLFHWLAFLILKRRGYARPETVMTLVIFNLGMLCGLTVTGIWFRGEGMALTLPF